MGATPSRENPPFCLPWGYVFTGRGQSLGMHFAVGRAYWRTHPRTKDRMRRIVGFVKWPFISFRIALRLVARYGEYVESTVGKGRTRQFSEAVLLAWRYSIPPRAYFLFRMYDDERKARATDYMHRFETKNEGAFRLIHRHRDTNPLTDKAEFYDRCLALGLPVVPNLLVVSKGVVIEPDESATLPGRDLFVKPRAGKGGRGATRYDFQDGRYIRPGDREPTRFTVEELMATLRSSSMTEDLIVQPRLVNHPDLFELSTGALTTIRVLTCTDEQGEPEVICAVFRMAVGSNVTVDNIHAGGIAAELDLQSGCLGRATALDPTSPWHSTHPTTGGVIEGRRMPMFDEVMELSRRSHAAFSECVIAGWDVGVTTDGVILVEGNSAPCVNLLQRPLDRGLAGGRFGELLRHHLDRIPARPR